MGVKSISYFVESQLSATTIDPTAFCPGLRTKLDCEEEEHSVVFIVDGLKERVDDATAPLLVVVCVLTRYKTTGIARIRNARLPIRKYLLLKKFIV